MKKNAKEYLLEFANNQQEKWLKALTYEAIQTNGAIDSERRKVIFSNLKDSVDIEFTIPEIETYDNNNEIRITKLVHKSGVNALEDNQTIKFSNDVTILYGMNGSGKSGYFKVLNELVGGNQKKHILPNIYIDARKEIIVEICYKESNGHINAISWTGDTRSLPKLNKCKVFDSSYLNGLLITRTTDTTLIEPLGLNLFAYLINLIDEFKSNLEVAGNEKRIQKPNIDLTLLSKEKQNIFNSHNFNLEQKKEIERLFAFSPEDTKKLDEVSTEIKNLSQINIQDKIKLISNNKGEIDLLKSNIETKIKVLSEKNKSTEDALEEYIEKQQANVKAREQFEILRQIPANNTKEWKDFIVAGMQYSAKIENPNNLCVYCRQPLNDKSAIETVQSYGLFLKDNSEQELKAVMHKVDLLKKQIEQTQTEFTIADSIASIVSNVILNKSNLKEEIDSLHADVKRAKEQLIDKITNKKISLKIDIPKINEINFELTKLSIMLQTEIDKLSQENVKKQESIERLSLLQNVLLENEAICKQKSEIEKWFSIAAEEKELHKKASSLRTKQLSDLSTAAHNELITESLKQMFNEELDRIGYSNLNVTIEPAGTKKGVSSTKLVLQRSNDLTVVLSEGEQKAVALALFIAEIRLQNNTSPIILDDPVNSLDHKIAGRFAECLLSVDNQIILFNHNKLFLDAFETVKEHHICKNLDSGCNNSRGKHITIYDVISQGKNSKGVLRSHKANCAKEHLGEAKTLLNTSPFDEETKVSNLIRLTVECLIDEIIFNRQVPTKFNKKNSRIAWDELKRIKNDPTMIDKLKSIHGRCSGGEMHNGSEKEENPIELDEFKDMISYMENILI